MMYNQTEKRWYPCSGNGISRVYIYQNPVNQSFRVVGRKNDTQEVSVHCSIVRGLIYNEATATFHQWRHSGSVYGLNFLSQEESQNFSLWMNKCLDFVCGRIAWPCDSHVKEQPSMPRQVLATNANQGVSSQTAGLPKRLDNVSTHTVDVNQNISSERTYQSHHIPSKKVTLNTRKEEKPAETVQPTAKETGTPNFSAELKRCLQTRVQTTSSPPEAQASVNQAQQDSSLDKSSEMPAESSNEAQQVQKALRQELLLFQSDFLSEIREIVRSEIRNSRLSSDSFH